MSRGRGGEVVLWPGAPGCWRAYAAAGSAARLAAERPALRLEWALAGPAGWAIARCDAAVTLPAHWALVLGVRGTPDPPELQVKLVAAGGEDVWWWRRRGVAAAAGARLVLRRASLEFAWGPAGGGEPRRLSAVEVAVAGGAGGRGVLAIEALRIEPRAAAARPPRARRVRASSAARGHHAARVLDGDRRTTWRPAAGDAAPWLALDLGARREWGGLLVRFVGPSPACRVAASDDGRRWTPLAAEPPGAEGVRWLAAGEAEARFVRVELGGHGEVADAAVVPIELAASPARWAAATARRAPRGAFPRHLRGEQAPWAVVGGDGDADVGLLGEDGALEVGAEAFTLEPCLWTRTRLVTWADVRGVPSLADGCLPLPTVAWEGAPVGLRVTAFATGPPHARVLVARYVVENRRRARRRARLLVAVRPFQVLPAWQGLNVAPAVARLARLEAHAGGIRADGAREVVAVSAPDAAGATGGAGARRSLARGRVPRAARAEDPLGLAEGVLAWDLDLPAGGSEEIAVAVAAPPGAVPSALARGAAAAWARERLAETTAWWRERLARVPLALPACGAAVVTSLRASLAWILVNRDGPRIQPGPRCYRRSWIRDGTLTATALAEMGFADEAAAFLRWYAPHQAPDGRVPCAVDRHGVDPTVEHDSHGQLVWGVVETFRLTGDRALLDDLWPHAVAAAGVLARLRAERTGPAHRGTARFGLLPESISHEGYAARPVHAYWDDLFALRALGDAAEGAGVRGDAAGAARWAALRDAMRADVRASVARAMADHGVDFVPGAVELGDFDPTSTAIAFDPCGEEGALPRAALERTFERYWREVEARAARPPERWSPYELRNVPALLALGWKARALALLDRVLADQRPPGWRQWPEIVWRDPRAPRFLGDLPHGWVAATFVRAVRRLFAWERPDGTLLVAGGVADAWVREAPGVRVRGLPTHWGTLDLALRAEGARRVRASFGPGLRRPPAGIVLASPLARPLRGALVDGAARPAPDAGRLCLDDVPREVVLLY